jgi:toxin ParE1/3/4
VPGPVLEWRQAARDDLLAIVDTISDDNPAAAQALKDEIEAKVCEIAGPPATLPGRPRCGHARDGCA